MNRNAPRAAPRVTKKILGKIAALLLAFLAVAHFAKIEKSKISKAMLANTVGDLIAKQRHFPSDVELQLDNDEPFHAKIQYTVDSDLQAEMARLFDQYKPDYAAFVAINANTGRVITLNDFTKRAKDDIGHLVLQARFPAASIFKMVTATAAIDQRLLSAESVIPFNGASSTLYRRNVRETKVNRWTRFMPLKDAFAHSVNTVFGKIGVFFLGKESLLDYAGRFGFNRSIASDVPVQMSHTTINDEDPWAIVEAASGFTLKNTLSPLQAAMIASTVVNNGSMMEPYVVQTVQNEAGEILYEPVPKIYATAMDPLTASELRTLMEETVRTGTGRKAFRQFLKSKQYGGIEVGGKSGTLTGKDPFGKCDWFVGYATYAGENIAFAALTVHKEYWTVKSAYLARRFIEMYFDSRFPDHADGPKTLSRR